MAGEVFTYISNYLILLRRQRSIYIYFSGEVYKYFSGAGGVFIYTGGEVFIYTAGEVFIHFSGAVEVFIHTAGEVFIPFSGAGEAGETGEVFKYTAVTRLNLPCTHLHRVHRRFSYVVDQLLRFLLRKYSISRQGS